MSAAAGAWLAAVTVTSKDWLALSPAGSVAVTVMVAVPAATPFTVTSLPETLTVATSKLPELAV